MTIDMFSDENEWENPQETTLEMIELGTSWRFFYGKDHQENKLVHIRAIVDNCYIVFRWWKGKRWIYEIESWYYFYLRLKNGRIRKKE